MSAPDTAFSVEQLKAIEQLRAVLNIIKRQNIYVAGLHDYEVLVLSDAYISLT